jgi:hypothetical protein
MEDKRKIDRRKKKKSAAIERRKGPRRLVCDCGGRIEVIINKNGKGNFICLRCGKKH